MLLLLLMFVCIFYLIEMILIGNNHKIMLIIVMNILYLCVFEIASVCVFELWLMKWLVIFIRPIIRKQYNGILMDSVIRSKNETLNCVSTDYLVNYLRPSRHKLESVVKD